MECTQRLECTQELYDTYTERTCPEQIGFLGICGTKHPVVIGPNKIGRDPQTCNIVLNSNSISRQHAVINILNSREHMLMDLGSANKTKLENKALQSYIPHQLKNGDMVQFGDLFGVFRLLEENDDLPMTQAIDIPETPAPTRHASKLNKPPVTMIPESPDVSDKEDSFITLSKEKINHSSQTKSEKQKISNSQFITTFGKKLPIHPVRSPRTDSQTRRSSSLSFIDNPNTSLNESFASAKSDKNDNIHEMDTQQPNVVNENTNFIHTADTQIPEARVSSPSIHSLDTQIPITTPDHLPQVRKIHEQHDIQLDLYAANKENDNSIFNAETQPFPYNESMEIKKIEVNDRNASVSPRKDVSAKTVNTSDEELLFDEIDDEAFDEDIHSQALLPPELPFEDTTTVVKTYIKAKEVKLSDKLDIKPSKRHNMVQSDGSTDCEDDIPTQKVLELPLNENNVQRHDLTPLNRITCAQSDTSRDCEDIDMMLTQKIPELPVKKEPVQVSKTAAKASRRVNRIVSDDLTDCEDIDIMPTQKIPEKRVDKDEDLTDCEDDLNGISLPIKNSKVETEVKFEDMATQIIEPKYDRAFEDMPTQVVSVIATAIVHKNDVNIDDIATQIIDEVKPNNISTKKSINELSKPTANKTAENKTNIADDNFYAATQDIYKDLSSQREWSPEIMQKKVKVTPAKSNTANKSREDIKLPCLVEGKARDRSANVEIRSPQCSLSSDGEERVKRYVGSLSNQQLREIIGVDTSIRKLKRQTSDGSDVDKTPRKVKPMNFMNVDLPNSQEIKTSRAVHQNVAVTESSSESETEQNSEDYTPILFRKKKKPTVVAKIDLTKKFDVEKLPEKVITRVRKPTNKMESKKILKPEFLTEQEDQIDKDIIIENITRLKNEYKSKGNTDVKVEEEKKSSKKGPDKSKEPKEKIKVKIARPKRNTSKKNESTRKSDGNDKSKSLENTLDSTADSRRGIRSTRNRNKDNGNKHGVHKSVPPDNTKPFESKIKHTSKKDAIQDRVSPEVEVRRSKRQQSSKAKKEEAPKSILKKSSHEQSTVYNVSSSSDVTLKRIATDDSDVPSPKRTRSMANNTSNMSRRATPAMLPKTQHVLFTAFPSEEVKEKLENVGAVIVNDVNACTVVSTIKIKRTCKLLCAVGLGRPIVGPDWIQACVDTRMLVDPWLHLIKDEETEKRFNFNLEKSLRGKRNYLKGYNISSTPSVQPKGAEMKLIVECSGGTWKEGGTNWVCVSSNADRALWPSLKKRGATVVSVQFILDGVLKQTLDIAGNVLN